MPSGSPNASWGTCWKLTRFEELVGFIFPKNEKPTGGGPWASHHNRIDCHFFTSNSLSISASLSSFFPSLASMTKAVPLGATHTR